MFPEPCVGCSHERVSNRDQLCARCRSALRSWSSVRVCSLCGIPVPQFVSRCARCRKADFAFDWVRPLFPYEGVPANLIRSFKFAGRQQVAHVICLHIAELLDTLSSEGWLEAPIVPVPSSRRGTRARGFESADVLASTLAASHSRPVWRPLTHRGAKSQKKLDFEGRFAHASHAIQPRRKIGVVPRRAILVDDVFTTGATLSRCAAILKALGSVEVGAVVFVMEEE